MDGFKEGIGELEGWLYLESYFIEDIALEEKKIDCVEKKIEVSKGFRWGEKF